MKECTIDELIKSNRLCASGDCGSECYFYIYDEFCQDELKARSADRLVSQQNEIENYKSDYATLVGRNKELKNEIEDLKKKIAETYTANDYLNDSQRLCDTYEDCKKCPAFNVCTDAIERIPFELVKDWAKSHPEPQKISNGDKFKEVFGRNPKNDFCLRPEPKCIHSEDATTCNHCDYGYNGEYKEPSDK